MSLGSVSYFQHFFLKKTNLKLLAGAQKLHLQSTFPGYSELTSEEIKVCETLRLYPESYLHIKRSLLTAVFTFGPFKKRDAQLWFRIDVNKTSLVYEWFKRLGWIPSDEETWRQLLETKKSQNRQVGDTRNGFQL